MKKIEELYSIFKESSGVSTDSRKITKGCIFFALKGDNFNGNAYAKTALESGANYAVIDEEDYFIDEKTLLVEDVLATLQEIAAYHRNQFKFPVIGITGTNGKTTTKELIYSVLKEKYKAYATMGNLNNHIGVPLTLLSIPLSAEIAVVEMGANHIGEIEELCKIAKPDYGIITNIGKAHIEGFGSVEGVRKAKGELYDSIRKNKGTLFVNADDETLTEMSAGIDRSLYGNHPDSQVKGEVTIDNGLVTVGCSIENVKYLCKTKLTGKYNLPNILAACCIGSYFSVPNKNIQLALENYTPSNNRSQIKDTDKNRLILDAYNANPESMRLSIDNFISLKTDRTKLAILGDMLELGAISNEEHTQVVRQLKSEGFDNVIFVGAEFKAVSKNENIRAFKNVEKAIEYIKNNPIENCLILLKGSRGIRIEKTINYL